MRPMLSLSARSLSLALALSLAAGCVATEYRGTVGVTATTPDLVSIGPGVHVIADYDEPIFYSDGFYWWFFDGFWYRSATYTGGWVRIGMPPPVIVRIDQPHRYRYYRPSGYVTHRRPVPSHRVQRPIVRDHRRR